MKSLRHRGGIAGDIKLNGKRELALGCGCCVVQNLKHDFEVRRAENEIREFNLIREKAMKRKSNEEHKP